jgi:hypothetical protein
MKIETIVEITPHNMVIALSRNELLDFIQELDIRVSETDFTLNLITLLLESVRGDMTSKEYYDFVEQFKF